MNTKKLAEDVAYLKRCVATLEEVKGTVLAIPIKEQIKSTIDGMIINQDGGGGSGNWGHMGVVNQWGGSAPGGGLIYRGGSAASGYKQTQKNVTDKIHANGKKYEVVNGKRVEKKQSTGYANRGDYDKFMTQAKADLKTLKGKYKSTSDPVQEAQHLADIKKLGAEIDKATLEHFNNDVSNCKSVEDVQEFLRANRLMTQTRTGVQTIDLKGCDLESAKSVARAYIETTQRFPQLKGVLGGVKCQMLGKYTLAAYNNGTKCVYVNPNYYGSVDKLKTAYDKCVQQGFHPQGTDYQSVVTHEIGHAVDFYLTSKVPFGKFNELYVSKGVLKDIKGTTGTSMKALQKGVSGYAEKDHYEFFAEAFAEGLSSSSPRDTAQRVVSTTEDLLKQYT